MPNLIRLQISTLIAVCKIVNMKFKAKTIIVTRKNLFIKEPTALNIAWHFFIMILYQRCRNGG